MPAKSSAVTKKEPTKKKAAATAAPAAKKPKRRKPTPAKMRPKAAAEAMALLAAGKTQKEVATAVGVTQPAISIWKSKLSADDKAELQRMSEVYNQQYAQRGMEFVAEATEALFAQLRRKLDSDEPVKDLREISQPIKHIYETASLAAGRSTNNQTITSQIDPELSELLKIALRRESAQEVENVPYTVNPLED